MIGKKMALIALIMLGTLTTFANAATISVKQLGCGTATNCYNTITLGVANAQDGDTVLVYPGTYTDSIVLGKNITLLGMGPQTTIINTSTTAITVKSNFSVTISGFTIKSTGGNGIYLEDASSSKIKNNYIVGNGKCGVTTVTNWLNDGALSSIVNNVIVSNSKDGIYAANTNSYKVGISNNIISNNGGYGINVASNTGTNSYNDIFSNTSGSYSGAVAGTGEISLNPLFVDAANGNYVLQSTSPCKNAGSPGIADLDPDGTRNDIGAFGGPSAAAFWPYPSGTPIITNLTATPTSVQKGATITITATGQVQ
jgi:parallel beta-helix repeat (two copies)